MILRKFFFVLVIFLFFNTSLAATKVTKKRAEIDSQNIIEVRYSNPDWNKSSSEIDTGVILLRDSQSKKTLQILLEETAPDSGIYSGTYSINWTTENIRPEVYVLNFKKTLDDKTLSGILQQIEQGQIKRKPLFYRKNERGMQTLQVFDNKEQMNQALAAIRAQNQQTAGMELSSITGKEFSAAKAIMTSQEYLNFLKESLTRRKESQKKLVDRIRQEQIEENKIQNLQMEYKKLTPTEQKKRSEEASDFAEEALDFYRGGQFSQSERAFDKSFSLNPQNPKYYFQYGLSLYKNKKFNEAIIALNISAKNKEYELESHYYAGLSEYNLQEYEVALARFHTIVEKKDKILSPLASFYSGVILFEQKNYEKAKDEFQFVLDTSEDPKLDEKAEAYIDNINRAIAFAKNKINTLFLSASLGALYDSNVLLQSDSSGDQGTPQDKGSLRYILGLGAFYRPVYNDQYEFGPKLRTDYIFTQNSDLTDYDPWSVQLSAPFTYKSVAFQKPMKLDLKPGYELLYLGQDGSGKPQKTLDGLYLEIAPTFIMSERWVSTYSLLYRNDRFTQTSSQGANANKIAFKFSNLLSTESSKTKNILIDVGYTMNAAKENSYKYQRYDLAVLYMTPVFAERAHFAGGVNFYQLNYNKRSQAQHDLNTALTSTVSKPISEHITGMVLATYVFNNSNVSSFDYNKWTLGILLNMDYGF